MISRATRARVLAMNSDAQRELFMRLSEQIGEQLKAHGVSEEEVLADFTASRRRR